MKLGMVIPLLVYKAEFGFGSRLCKILKLVLSFSFKIAFTVID